ncbi:LysR substrate-binding domain-containing protein [Bosea sp. NPDC003192]|uniref:LysR substrate-binding domain-containing protein n=1 Tax=Bosea sp. NPDC003192 TaxID=3390551 RepID=UPI003CFF9987
MAKRDGNLRLPLNAVRAFEVAARHESFAAAAEELHVTPAAVSRHVRLLESLLERQLFERRPQSLVLTRFGREWLPALTDAFNVIESSASRAFQPREAATVTLSVQAAFAVGWLLPRLADFYRLFPQIELKIYTHTETPMLSSDGRHDAMIISGRGEWPDCEATFLLPNQMLPVCSPAYLGDRPPPRQPSDLLAEALIVSEANSEDWRDWFASFGLKHVTMPRRIAFPTGFLPVQAAIHGLGISLADRSLIGDDLASGRLVMPLDAPMLNRGTGWYLVGVPGRRTDRPYHQVVTWLRAQAEPSG